MTHKIDIVGLGSGDLDHLPYGIYKRLREAENGLYLRTIDHPVVAQLQEEGLKFTAFDHLYEKELDFYAVYEAIVHRLMKEAKEADIVYAVPGHPMLAEKTVQLLLESEDLDVNVIGGQSYLDALFTAVKIDPIEGFQFVDGTSFDRYDLNYRQHLLFCQVYDQFIASNVKLALLEDLPADYKVYVIDAAGSSEEKVIKTRLEDLDRSFDMSNLTTLYIPPVKDDQLNHTFTNLRQTIAILRGPNGCPWDRRQTHESLRPYAIEEVYELIDAIDREDDDGIVEELGDVLLQVMLHSQIGEDNGYFTIDDVIKSITEKMIHRHPHVFADEESEDLNKTWQELKEAEKEGKQKSILDDVTAHVPALQKAYDLQKKVNRVGFNWENIDGVWEKLHEELDELLEAIKHDVDEEVEKELGDVLFVLINIAIFKGVNPELALNQTNKKFISRFSHIEDRLREQGKSFSDVTLEQMDLYWNEAKRKE